MTFRGINRMIVFSFLVVTIAVSGQDDASEFMDLSLTELLNMTITTASKQEESLSESPAIVSVITSRDLLTSLNIINPDVLFMISLNNFLKVYTTIVVPDIFN